MTTITDTTKCILPKSHDYWHSKNDYNDVVEKRLTAIEYGFIEVAELPVIPIISGPLRSVFGCAEAVGAIFYTTFKVAINAPYNRIRYGKREAKVSLNEGKRALLYIPHGIANIFGGIMIDLWHFKNDGGCSEDTRWPYPTEKERRNMPLKELLP